MGKKRKATVVKQVQEEEEEEDLFATALFAFQEAQKLLAGEASILSAELNDASASASASGTCPRTIESDITALLKLSINACKEVIEAVKISHTHSPSRLDDAKNGCRHDGDVDEDEMLEGPRALHSDALVLLGKVIEWNQVSKAKVLYEEAIDANPLNAEAHLQLGRLLYSQAIHLDQAEALLRKSISISIEESRLQSQGMGKERKDGDDDNKDQIEEGGSMFEAKKTLARLLCQSKGAEKKIESHEILLSLGFKHCLAHELTSANFLVDSGLSLIEGDKKNENRGKGDEGEDEVEVEGEDEEGEGAKGSKGGPLVSAWDDAFPPLLLNPLISALGSPTAPFWTEHAYSSPATGFFSYQLPLQPWGKEEREDEEWGFLSRVLHHLRRVAARSVPETKEATWVEFWAHSRGHSSGHKLHFDYIMRQKETSASGASEEATERRRRGSKASKLRAGAHATKSRAMVPFHPIVSTVSYLSPSSCGGPTLVTDQVMAEGSKTTEGWVVQPKMNRVLIFKGTQLHCVLPGVGTRPESGVGTRRGGVDGGKAGDGKRVGNGKGEGEGEGEGPRRVTFMASFWKVDPNAPPAFPNDPNLQWPLSFKAPLFPTKNKNLSPSEDMGGLIDAWVPVRAPVIKISKIHEPLVPRPLPPSAVKGGKAIIKGGRKVTTKPPAAGHCRSVSEAPRERIAIDLLAEDVFSDFSSLGNGLLIGGAASACSLNCGGKCEACRAAKRRKKV